MNIEQKAEELSEISKFSVPITKTKALEFLTQFRDEVIEECAVVVESGVSCNCGEAFTKRKMHSTECSYPDVMDAASDIRALKK